MKIICAWCGKFIGGDKNAAEVSHGICDSCLQKQLAEIEESRKEEKR